MFVEKRLTLQEEEIMQIVWRLKGAFIKEIQELLPDPKPPYTTVASTVRNLEKKKYLKSKKFANANRYEARIDREQYKKDFTKGLVNAYFLNSYKELVTFFARENKISSEELKEIIDIIENHKS